MKIENKGIRITEVPGVNWIQVAMEGGPSIEIDWADGSTAGVFSPENLSLLIEALQEALKATGHKGEDSGPWARWQDIPDTINQVFDVDGDSMRKHPHESWEGYVANSDDHLKNRYAPYSLTR